MTLCKYEDITIASIEKTMETGYIEEIIFNADKKTIEIDDKYIEKITDIVMGVYKEVCDALCKTAEEAGSAFCDIWLSLHKFCADIAKAFSSSDFSKLTNQKITKKKFIKLLTSVRIQRNQINEIIKNNTEQYTYSKFYITVNKYLK